MASADYYLKIDTIEGESEAVGFEKQMQIESWSFGASNSGSSGLGTGAGTGKCFDAGLSFCRSKRQSERAAFPRLLQRQPHSASYS